MKIRLWHGITALMLASVVVLAGAQNATKLTLISIGSGSVGGVYYPTAGALCRLLNKNTDKHRIRCLADQSGGSIQNVADIRRGVIDFGIVQTDVQANAYSGVGQFEKNGAASRIRSLFTVHAEPFTIVARLDSGIRHFTDLVGKRVSLEKQGSGTRATAELVLNAFEMTEADLGQVLSLSATEASSALCENRIDAYMFVVGHPNRAVREVSETCAVRLVEISGKPIDDLLKTREYYTTTTIPGGLYVGNVTPVATFGVRASIVGLESIPEPIAYHLTRAVFEQLEDLRRLHPAFQSLSAQEMMSGNTAPLHPGAKRYFAQVKQSK